MAISKVVYGDDTLMDISEDTVTSENMLRGVTAHGADGEPVVGIANGTWTGTRAQYESEKDSIADGTIVNITDDYEAGGGGGTDSIDITKAEYDALPDSKLTDGKNYFVTDWNSQGGSDLSIVPLEIGDVFTNLEHVSIRNWNAYKIANKIIVINCALVCEDSWLSNQTTILGDLNPQNRPLSPLVKTSSYSTNYTQIFLTDEKLKIRPVGTNMGIGFTSYLDLTYICG